MKILVNKMCGPDEQFTIEVEIAHRKQGGLTGDDVYEQVRPALEAIDRRLLGQSLRMIEHNALVSKLPVEAQIGLRQSLEVLFNRRIPGTAELAQEYERVRREQNQGAQQDRDLVERVRQESSKDLAALEEALSKAAGEQDHGGR